MERQVLHINITDFLVSVEEVVSPRLRGRPVAVAPLGQQRAVLYDLSIEAQRAGLCKGMLLSRAQRLCKDLVVIPPRMDLYRRAMSALLEHSSRYSPCMEFAGMGHIYLDLTGLGRLFGRSVDTAIRIKNEIKERYRLSSTAGLGSNKLVSKVATRVVKPDGFCSILIGGEEAFLAPLPIKLLPDMEPAQLKLLHDLNIRTVGLLASLTLQQLYPLFGKEAVAVYRRARGIDLSPVGQSRKPLPVVKEQYTFDEDTNDKGELVARLFYILERATKRLREMKMAAKKATLQVEFSDRHLAIRRLVLKEATNLELCIFPSLEPVLVGLLSCRTRIRRMTVTLYGLVVEGKRLSLMQAPEKERLESLTSALDRIRDRWGQNAVAWLGRNLDALKSGDKYG